MELGKMHFYNKRKFFENWGWRWMTTSKGVTISICMATYNGELYISSLLKTLESQQGPNFEIIVRDDCSRDNTLKILKKFKKESRHTIRIIEDKKGKLGPEANFLETVRQARGELILFCDQDDLWAIDKVEKFREQYFKENLKDKSAILFNDYLVFGNLNGFRKVIELELPLSQLKYENYIPGCCMGLTTDLANKMVKVGCTGLMHDWNAVILNYVAEGKFIRIPLPLTQYRQHDCNTIGYNQRAMPNFDIVNFLTNMKSVKVSMQKLGAAHARTYYIFYIFHKIRKIIYSNFR
ncbi:hypothetical protein B9057_15035 (plasmid) [Aestuarium zhoushanense]|nr:hypothetical protein B9057_15035 [Aestuarium zhoushanense]